MRWCTPHRSGAIRVSGMLGAPQPMRVFPMLLMLRLRRCVPNSERCRARLTRMRAVVHFFAHALTDLRTCALTLSLTHSRIFVAHCAKASFAIRKLDGENELWPFCEVGAWPPRAGMCISARRWPDRPLTLAVKRRSLRLCLGCGTRQMSKLKLVEWIFQ